MISPALFRAALWLSALGGLFAPSAVGSDSRAGEAQAKPARENPLLVNVDTIIAKASEERATMFRDRVSELARQQESLDKRLAKMRADDKGRPALEAEIQAVRERLTKARDDWNEYSIQAADAEYRQKLTQAVLQFLEAYRDSYGFTAIFDTAGKYGFPAPPGGSRMKEMTKTVSTAWNEGNVAVQAPAPDLAHLGPPDISRYDNDDGIAPRTPRRVAEKQYVDLAEAIDAEGIDGKVRPTKVVPPEYPEEASKQRIEGVVDILFVVETDGSVRHAEVRSSAHPLLDAVALAAVKKWRFAPMTANGKPVRVWMLQRFPFRARR